MWTVTPFKTVARYDVRIRRGSPGAQRRTHKKASSPRRFRIAAKASKLQTICTLNPVENTRSHHQSKRRHWSWRLLPCWDGEADGRREEGEALLLCSEHFARRRRGFLLLAGAGHRVRFRRQPRRHVPGHLWFVRWLLIMCSSPSFLFYFWYCLGYSVLSYSWLEWPL